MILHMEYDKQFKKELHTRMEYAKKMGLFKEYFGQLAIYIMSPGSDCGEGEKATFGTMDLLICALGWWDSEGSAM